MTTRANLRRGSVLEQRMAKLAASVATALWVRTVILIVFKSFLIL
jgi:hypothetical protein